MNLHLQGLKPNEPNKKRGFQKQTSFTNTDLTAFYRIMWLTLLFAFFSAGTWAQIKPVIPPINTNGGGTMLIIGDGGGGGGGGGTCDAPVITTNITSGATYYVTVNGTAPQLTISATNGTASYQWFESLTTNINDFEALSAFGTTFTPDVSTVGTFYYVGNATNSCGVTGTPMATVIVSPAVTAPVAGTITGGATVCTGINSTVLTLNGYTGTIQWQSSTDNGTFTDISSATGASYTATNLAATTWYRTVVSSGGTSAISSGVSITVNQKSSAPLAATADPSTICNGQSTILTYHGGSLGTNAVFNWYTDAACTSPAVATGQFPTVSPTVTTTYYGRYEDPAPCNSVTATTSVTVTVNPNASAGTVSAGTSPQCIGSTTTYTVSSAILSGGTGAWSSDNTAVATVDPSSGAVTAIGGGTCNIIYTVTGGCGGTQTASQSYSVIASIDASANSNPIALGSAVSLSATISPAISGVTVTFNLDPGTGIITTYTAVTNTSGMATTAPISGLSVNVYKVIATAAGCAVSNAAYLPIYDPNSSFVTGGGWIISPAGALVAQPLLSGKANFGFVAKYQKGSSNVNGNTEFDFNDGDFNFASSSLTAGTLVISGAKATYRGEGTVNGIGNYGFVVTAVDGQINGSGGTDLFRIKIWDKSNGNTVVYDNNMGADENGVPTTALGGGSIVIHYSKNTTSRVMGTGSSVEVVNSNSNQLTGVGKLTVKVMPNPSSYHFSFGLNSLSQENIKIIVTDIIGRVIDIKTNVPANSTIQLGDNYQHGIYIAEFLQGNDKVTLRLLKE